MTSLDKAMIQTNMLRKDMIEIILPNLTMIIY